MPPFVWPIATAVGSYIGGKLGAGGGDKKDKDSALAQADPYMQMLQESSKGLRKQGQEFGQTGSEALGPVLEHFKNLLSGDPQALLNATKAQRGRVIDQYDSARQAITNFGPRGGGTTSALAASRFSEANALSDITSQAQEGAAGALAQLGPQLAGLGLSAQQLASADLESVIRAIFAQKGLDLQRRGQNLEALTGIGEALGNLFGIWITRDKGGKP